MECSGTFVEGGDLEIACTTPVGGQTISTLLYSLNGGPTVEGRVDICFGNRVVLIFSSSISVENPSLPFIIDASALSDSNVVDFTVIGSQGSQLTPSLEFSASSNVTLTLSLYLHYLLYYISLQNVQFNALQVLSTTTLSLNVFLEEYKLVPRMRSESIMEGHYLVKLSNTSTY